MAIDSWEDENPSSPGPLSTTEVAKGFDWLSGLLIAALLIVILAQAGLSIKSIAAGAAALVVPIGIIVAVVGAVRRFWSSDRVQVERLKILERVLESPGGEDSDPYLKRRALEAVIAAGQESSQDSPGSQGSYVTNVKNVSNTTYTLAADGPEHSASNEDA